MSFLIEAFTLPLPQLTLFHLLSVLGVVWVVSLVLGFLFYLLVDRV